MNVVTLEHDEALPYAVSWTRNPASGQTYILGHETWLILEDVSRKGL